MWTAVLCATVFPYVALMMACLLTFYAHKDRKEGKKNDIFEYTDHTICTDTVFHSWAIYNIIWLLELRRFLCKKKKKKTISEYVHIKKYMFDDLLVVWNLNLVFLMFEETRGKCNWNFVCWTVLNFVAFIPCWTI